MYHGSIKNDYNNNQEAYILLLMLKNDRCTAYFGLSLQSIAVGKWSLLQCVCMCAEASALQFSWQAGQSWQTRPAWVSKGFLKAVVVSDASAAVVCSTTNSR